MNYRLLYSCFVWLLLAMAGSGYAAGRPGNMRVEIRPMFDGKPLQLADKQYIDQHGDTLYIDVFRFYITNLKLYSDYELTEDRNSHLADAEDTASLHFMAPQTNVKPLTKIQFTLGVDSITNTNGANSGDLDPARGMYWAWNSGYIMSKIEGRSPVCRTRHHVFQYHVGGYMPPYNAARTITLPVVYIESTDPIKDPVLRIEVEVAELFNSGLDIAKTNEVMIPGKEACAMADRYVQMFKRAIIAIE